MKAWIRLWAGVAVLLASALPAAGEERVALVLVDGTMVKGRLEGLSATDVSIWPEGEAAPRVLPYDRIEPIHVYYLLRDRLAQATGMDPAKARLAIADYCLEHNLYYFAGVEYERASELDPSLESEAREGMDTAEEGQADAFYRRGMETYARGDVSGARAILRKAAERFPNSGTAVLIANELARLDDGARRAAERKAERERKEAEALQAKVARRAELLEEYLRQRAAEASGLRDAAANDTNVARARNALLESNKGFEGLLPYIQELEKYDLDRAGVWREWVKKDLVENFNFLAAIDLGRQNARQSNFWITQALMLDPENRRAKDLRDIYITYGLEQDPFRMPVGELAGRIHRRTANPYMVRAFLRRTGDAGLNFLRQEGILP